MKQLLNRLFQLWRDRHWKAEPYVHYPKANVAFIEFDGLTHPVIINSQWVMRLRCNHRHSFVAVDLFSMTYIASANHCQNAACGASEGEGVENRKGHCG